MNDRRMAHARRAHLDVRVLHDEAGLREFVRGDELAQVGPALVADARLDVETVELKVSLGHRLDRRRAVSVHRRAQARCPAVVDQVAVIEVVV